MMLRALAAWCPVRGASGPFGEEEEPWTCSLIKAARATAPKPLAERSSISRRVSVDRAQWRHDIDLASVNEDKLLDVDQHVAEVGPDSRIVGAAAVAERLLLQKVDCRSRLFGARRPGKGGLIQAFNSLLGCRAFVGKRPLRPACTLSDDERVVHQRKRLRRNRRSAAAADWREGDGIIERQKEGREE